MEFLSGYLLSIVGVVLLTVLIDLILPDGKMAKYVKSVMAIVVVAVIISPIAKLTTTDFDFGKLFSTTTYQVDQVILDNITNLSVAEYERDLEKNLASLGYEDVHISLIVENKDGTQIIKYIYVDLCDFGISEDFEHIDYYTEIKECLKKLVDFVKEEQIVVYG